MEINYLTIKVMESIKHNRRKEYLSKATDIKDLKKMWLVLMYPTGKPSEGFIKGAKTINFEAIWQYVKS